MNTITHSAESDAHQISC